MDSAELLCINADVSAEAKVTLVSGTVEAAIAEGATLAPERGLGEAELDGHW